MDYLLVVYTNDDFVNENEGVFYQFDGDISSAITTETVVFWEWPGSDRDGDIWGSWIFSNRTPITQNAYYDKTGREWTNDYSESTEWFYIEYAYKDREGREWIYVETYWNQPVMGWICLSDPDNSEILSFNSAPTLINWSPSDVSELPPSEPLDGKSYAPLIISLGAAFVVGAVVFRLKQQCQ